MQNLNLSDAYHEYLKSDHWKTLRGNVLQKRGFICEATGIKIHKGICHVHHLTYKNLYDVETGDLMVLSSFIHNILHKWKDMGLLKARNSAGKRKEVVSMVKQWIKDGMPGEGKCFRKCRKWLISHTKPKKAKRRKKSRKWREYPKPWSAIKSQLVPLRMTEQERHDAFYGKLSYKGVRDAESP